jgi:hypothetical protein
MNRLGVPVVLLLLLSCFACRGKQKPTWRNVVAGTQALKGAASIESSVLLYEEQSMLREERRVLKLRVRSDRLSALLPKLGAPNEPRPCGSSEVGEGPNVEGWDLPSYVGRGVECTGARLEDGTWTGSVFVVPQGSESMVFLYLVMPLYD